MTETEAKDLKMAAETNDTPVLEPRPESRPLSREEVTDEQWAVLEQATQLLASMAVDPPPVIRKDNPRLHFLPLIETNRTNRVVLIDGSRGSGKTAVLVTLLDLYVRRVLGESLPNGFDPLFEREPMKSAQIVPVDWLDLQPLPNNVNLLLQFTSSLERLARYLQTLARDKGDTAPKANAEKSSLQAWRDFAGIAAVGWQKTQGVRPASLVDRDTFAHDEVDLVYQTREVVPAFTAFLNALVREYVKYEGLTNGMPLFLIPLDDADMNPDRADELLELIRRFWHPNLAYVLTGHSEVFIEALGRRQEYENLAEEVYRKDIPPGHRLKLRELSAEERLGPRTRLAQVLGRITFPVDATEAGGVLRETRTLLEYVNMSTQPDVRMAFPGRLRHLHDFAEELHQLAFLSQQRSKGSSSATVIDAIRFIWDATCKGTLFPKAGNEHWKYAVRFDEALPITFDETLLALTRHVLWRSTRIDSEWSLRTSVPVHSSVHGTLGETSQRVGDHLAAAWLLARMVGADLKGNNGGIDEPDQYAPLNAELVRTEWNLKDLGASRAFAWPVPAWPSPIDLNAFERGWRRLTQSPSAVGGMRVDELARQFVNLILDVSLSRGLTTTEDSKIPEWKELVETARRIAESKASRNSARGRAISAWRFGWLGLFAAPELRLDVSSAEELLETLKATSGENWPMVRSRLRENRQKWYRLGEAVSSDAAEGAMLRSQIEHLITRLDGEDPEHPFLRLVEERASAYWSTRTNEFDNGIMGFQVPFAKRTFGTERYLQAYFTPRTHELLSRAPAKGLRKLKETLDRVPNRQTGAAAVLTSFWREAVLSSQHSERESDIELNSSGSLTLSVRALEWAKAIKSTWTNDENGTISKDNQVISPLHFTGLPDSLQLKPFEQAILSICYSFHLDDVGKNGEPVIAWPAFETIEAGVRMKPWPVPNWLGLWERESAVEGWNRLMQPIQEDPKNIGNLCLADAFIMPFLRFIESLTTGHRSRWEIEYEPEVKLRQHALTVGEAIRSNQQLNRPRALMLAEWQRRMFLFATPEAGLSSQCAAVLLKGLVEKDTISLTRQEIHRARASFHGASMNFTDRQIDELLKNIDRDNPDHPWVERFGVHGT